MDLPKRKVFLNKDSHALLHLLHLLLPTWDEDSLRSMGMRGHEGHGHIPGPLLRGKLGGPVFLTTLWSPAMALSRLCTRERNKFQI